MYKILSVLVNGQRSFYHSKPRAPFRNSNYDNQNQHPKIPFHERNGFLDNEEKMHSFRKSHNSHSSNPNTVLSNTFNRKEDSRNMYVFDLFALLHLCKIFLPNVWNINIYAYNTIGFLLQDTTPITGNWL